MPDTSARFVWYELLTDDPAAATSFYTDVVGWTAAAFAGAGPPYTILSAAAANIAGVVALPNGAPPGRRPGWIPYVGVDDVDAATAAVAAAGGTVHARPQDLPGVGRLAQVADPQGILFNVMRGSSPEPSTAFDNRTPGHCAWNELRTTDMPAALAFYTTQFGWTAGPVMSMGPMGDYQFLEQDGRALGAMMHSMPAGPPPAWGFYFRVPDIAAAAARVTGGGGAIHHGPVEVPGGEHVVIAADPQGASFGLVGP